eukprot:1243631-Pleurochrysis_carterae.AAC.4
MRKLRNHADASGVGAATERGGAQRDEPGLRRPADRVVAVCADLLLGDYARHLAERVKIARVEEALELIGLLEEDEHWPRRFAAAPASVDLARDGLEVVALVHAQLVRMIKRQLDVVARIRLPVALASLVHGLAVSVALDADVVLEHLVRARRQLRLIERAGDAED